MKRLRSATGLSLLEVLIGGTIFALCLIAFVGTSGKLAKNQALTVNKTKAMAAASAIMEDIRSQAWDRTLVGKAKSETTTTPSPIGSSDSGDSVTGGVYDDIDDFDGRTIADGPLATSIAVNYATGTFDSNGVMVITTYGDGKGAAPANRTNFKLITTTTTWREGQLVLQTVAANGR